MNGIITKIQRLSLHDGPGIRSVIFMKGCNMRCKWCHNPETFHRNKEIERIENKCIQCKACIEVCDTNALNVNNGKVHFNVNKCNHCLKCSEECYSGAMHVVGEDMTKEKLFQTIEQDIPFFKSSNGGITFSGGEPLLQHQFIIDAVKYLKDKGLHITIESNFSISWNIIKRIIPFVDYWMIDLKLMDEDNHRMWTSIGNKKIINNILELDKEGVSYELRTTLVPSVNDNDKELSELKKFLKSLKNIKSHKLNPYHQLGEQKYRSLGWDYPLQNINEMSQEDIEVYSKILQ
ncbi:glycyl-radical enzyme activating protein [Flammeovirga pacifica]|uniref:Glycyl-radical enzyme activating protein n=1 Tax=Flammeovirga pacifica TaxID=915059 RepID=A0A1S1YTF0_FLAPC|nr:glycyl-radical enzyme activating protein [Flammeovirga pacifica]OHX64300.1 hypothetical protein NH26_22145 [Flammeovirga pacifica]